MKRVPFDELKQEFLRVLRDLGFREEKADAIAEVFACNSRDGVYSHGLNRFPVFVDYVKEGLIAIDAEPVCEESFGAVERWDGRLGPGILNAQLAMNRAMEIAAEYGIGCIALKNTNHWMRGGTYGWQAAEAGFISVSFTNTIANMPPWGGTEPRLGNNPLVIAVPRANGPVVLDMAMTQYSYGKLEEYKLKGEELPYDGGFDQDGNLSTKPAEIINSKRPLPIGLWKGSGLSLVLDLLATVLSKGKSTGEISASKKESGISQVFICIKPRADAAENERLINEILSYTKSTNGKDILYPGERTLSKRKENLEKGVLVDESLWEDLLEL